MADDLFASFSKPPPPSSTNGKRAPAPVASSSKLDPAHSSASSSRQPSASTAAGTKRQLSPQDGDAPKKPRTSDVDDSTPTAPLADEHSSTARLGDAFTATDELETTVTQTIKPSAGLAGGADAPDSSEGLVLQHQVRHQVALPPNYPYVPISSHVAPAEPARVYPFELDPFQKVSVASIQRNESVLVSAHTSAGKTVVAEYAIAQCLKQGQRVVYTSPIKVRPSLPLSLEREPSSSSSSLTRPPPRSLARRPSRTRSTARCSPSLATSAS